MPLFLASILCLLLLPLAQPSDGQPSEEEAQASPELPAGPIEEWDDESKRILSYALGYDVGRSVHESLAQMQANPEAFDQTELTDGLAAGFGGALPRYLQSQMEPLVEHWVTRQQTLAQAQHAELSAEAEKAWNEASAKNLEQARKFLTDNKFKKGVKETDSGLQYQISRKGKGSRPAEDAWVKVHYRGSTIDGAEFDSSYARNEPAVFPLDGVIPGWAEGMRLLKKGSQARLFVPPHLAYGEHQPQGGPLPFGPNSLLVFEVELLDFADSEEALKGQ